jgi:hypothetical protein
MKNPCAHAEHKKPEWPARQPCNAPAHTSIGGKQGRSVPVPSQKRPNGQASQSPVPLERCSAGQLMQEVALGEDTWGEQEVQEVIGPVAAEKKPRGQRAQV